MIEILFITLAALSLIATIFFLTQYGLRIRQMNLKEEQEQRIKDHQNKLANGYKWYEWRGTEIWISKSYYSGEETGRTKKIVSGEGYFKSEEDLRKYLLADAITLEWSREL